jgi:hypothetical protein
MQTVESEALSQSLRTKARKPERQIREDVPQAGRGNGHTSNPRRPLKPGDYGVHSHPDTAKLLGK